MKCENCQKDHIGSYGSGRFCSEKCSRSFSTKEKRKEINKRVSESLKGKKQPHCKNNALRIPLESKKKGGRLGFKRKKELYDTKYKELYKNKEFDL